jgi:hypothetical protein
VSSPHPVTTSVAPKSHAPPNLAVARRTMRTSSQAAARSASGGLRRRRLGAARTRRLRSVPQVITGAPPANSYVAAAPASWPQAAAMSPPPL